MSPTLDRGTRNIDLGDSAQIHLANLLQREIDCRAAHGKFITPNHAFPYAESFDQASLIFLRERFIS